MTETVPRLTMTQWLICFIASVGFAFDIYEILMLPLIVRPALGALGGVAEGGEGIVGTGCGDHRGMREARAGWMVGRWTGGRGRRRECPAQVKLISRIGAGRSPRFGGTGKSCPARGTLGWT